MSAEKRFALHPLAAQDIAEIWEFIADDSPQAARRVREELLASIRGLVSFPNSGHKRPDLTGRPLRFIVVRPYVIAYAPEEMPLWVVALCMGGAVSCDGGDSQVLGTRVAEDGTHNFRHPVLCKFADGRAGSSEINGGIRDDLHPRCLRGTRR